MHFRFVDNLFFFSVDAQNSPVCSAEFTLIFTVYFLDQTHLPFNQDSDMERLCCIINDHFTHCAFGTSCVSET
jgi:hypothetical protein